MRDKARVLGHRMTSQCASGSGQFLENICRYLGVTIDEIGPLSFGPDGMRGSGFFYPGAAPEFSEALSERIDAEVARLVKGKKVTIIGYGWQGYAHAEKLKE